MPEHLREEDRHAVLGELLDVGAEFSQPRDLRDLDAMDPLHDHDVLAAEVPVHLRHVQQRAAGEVALELRGIAGLAHEVELVQDRLFVLDDDFARPEAPGFRPVLLGEAGERVQHFEVEADRLAHAGTQHLDDDFAAVGQASRREPGRSTPRQAASTSKLPKSVATGWPSDFLDARLGELRRRRAARGPGASRARRRCRAAAGRGASRPPGRT